MVFSGGVIGLESKWRIRRRRINLKVNHRVSLKVNLRVSLRVYHRVNPSGVVRGRIQCRKRSVNLVCLVIIPRSGIHRVVGMVEDRHQQPTGVDMVKYNVQN